MKCCYCGQPITAGNMAQTFRVPLARGGDNTAENRRLCCLGCKTEKGDRTDREWWADKKRDVAGEGEAIGWPLEHEE